MATSVDTSVLSYLLLNEDPYLADAAERALHLAAQEGALVVSGPVMAELLAIGKWDEAELTSRLNEAGILIDDRWDRAVWSNAATAFSLYLSSRRPAEYDCPQCGTRQRFRCNSCHAELGKPKHVLSDFLIGAHALRYDCSLLTNDVGPYQSFFPDLLMVPLIPDVRDP